jgi:hypothetical protein
MHVERDETLNYRAARLATRHLGWLAALAMLLAGAAIARAGSVQIDDFSQPNPYQLFSIKSGMNSTNELIEMSAGAFGGERDMLYNAYGQAVPTTLSGFAGYLASHQQNGLWINSNGFAPTVTTLMYSINTDGETAPASLAAPRISQLSASIDLTNGGLNDRFLIHFLSSDAQPTVGLDVTISYTSPGGGSSSLTVNAQNTTSAFDLYVPFSSFAGHGDASLDDVNNISIVFNGVRKTANADFAVSMISTVPAVIVPEPATWSMMATALVGLAWVAHRRRARRWKTANVAATDRRHRC